MGDKKTFFEQFSLNNLLKNKDVVPPEVTVNDGLVLANNHLNRVAAGTSQNEEVDLAAARAAANVVKGVMLEQEKKVGAE